MDEPFAALDEQTRTRMWQELLKIHARTRATILFITHSLIEAVYLADMVRSWRRGPAASSSGSQSICRARVRLQCSIGASRGTAQSRLGSYRRSATEASNEPEYMRPYMRRLSHARAGADNLGGALPSRVDQPRDRRRTKPGACSGGQGRLDLLLAFRVTADEILLASAIAWSGGIAAGAVVGAGRRHARSSRPYSPGSSPTADRALSGRGRLDRYWSRFFQDYLRGRPTGLFPSRSRRSPGSALSIFAMPSSRGHWGRPACNSSIR